MEVTQDRLEERATRKADRQGGEAWTGFPSTATQVVGSDENQFGEVRKRANWLKNR
jgi:hypothetical protein